MSLSGIPFYTMGVFVEPLHADFGWGVGAIQLGLTISYLTTVAMLPVVAWLSNRLGARAIALASLTLLGLAFMSLGLQGGALWTFYLNWFFISLFGTGTLAITWTKPITHALTAGRGLGLGLALLGTGVIGIFAPDITRQLISAIGWRGAYFCLGAAPILIAAPVAYFFFHDTAAPSSGRLTGAGAGADLRDPRLWLLGAAFVVTSAGITGMIPNLVKIFTTGGLPRIDAVAATGVVGLFVIGGRVGCGALIDRLWAPGVAAVTFAITASACALIALGGVNSTTAIIVSALIGLATGAEFDLMPFLVSRYMPAERFSSSLAFISASFYIGAAAGGPSVAYFYDHFGSYRFGLWVACGLFAAGAAFTLLVGPYPSGQARFRHPQDQA